MPLPIENSLQVARTMPLQKTPAVTILVPKTSRKRCAPKKNKGLRLFLRSHCRSSFGGPAASDSACARAFRPMATLEDLKIPEIKKILRGCDIDATDILAMSFGMSS